MEYHIYFASFSPKLCVILLRRYNTSHTPCNSPPAGIGAVKRIIEPGTFIVAIRIVLKVGQGGRSLLVLMTGNLVDIVLLLGVVRISEVVIEVIVVLGDEIVWLVQLALFRTIQGSALCQEIFQSTGGQCEAWFVIRTASLPLEDWFVRSDFDCHCVLALGLGLGLSLDQAGHCGQEEQGGHQRDGDDEDQ